MHGVGCAVTSSGTVAVDVDRSDDEGNDEKNTVSCSQYCTGRLAGHAYNSRPPSPAAAARASRYVYILVVDLASRLRFL